MDPITVAIIAIVLLLVLLAIETPVAYALGISGAVGLVLLHSFSYATSVLGSAPFVQTFSFTLTVIPTFILIGIFAVHGNVANYVYTISNHVFRKLPGGLGAATVMACAGFAAVTGSSVATTATMARLAVDQMRRYGYPISFAAGLVACAGTLGIMIPPSIILVLYSVITGESAGRMLAAGILPGLLTATAYITYALIRGRKIVDPEMAERALATAAATSGKYGGTAGGKGRGTGMPLGAPSGGANVAGVPQVRSRDLPWRGLVYIGIIFTIVLGGIYSGLFTATESGAIGALAAFAIMCIELRRTSWHGIWAMVKSALLEAASTTGMVFAIVVGSSIFSAFLIQSGTPQALTRAVQELPIESWAVVVLFLLILVPLGMGLESISILIITMPLMYPVVISLGYDGIWFGILAVKLIEIGLVTPPVGISTFVAAASAKVPVEKVFQGVWPFLAVDVVVVAILFLFPEMVLWLPNLAQ